MTAPAIAALQPLRHRSFALLWSASLVSNVGSWMQTVAVGALVISRTGQASWAVLVAAGAFLPIGLLSPLGGALADRLPRRPVIAAGNLAEAVIAAAIAVLVARGQAGPYALLALVTLQGCVSALIGPFSQAILPDLVPRAEFLAAASLNSAQWNAGRIVGPALAGAAVAAFGFPASFVANAVSFLAVVIALLFIRLEPPPGRRDRLVRSLRDGLLAARIQPTCRSAIIVMGVVAFLAAPFIALVPAVALSLSGRGAVAVAGATAILTTAQGLGAVAGALFLPALALRAGRGRVLAWSLGLLPVTLVGYGAARSLWSAAALLFAVGLVYMSVLSGLQTAVQLHAPQEYRGRVLSLFMVALGVAYPLGSLAQGPLADRLGVAWVTIGSALVLVAAFLLASWLRPGLAAALTAREPAVAGAAVAGAAVAGPAVTGAAVTGNAVTGNAQAPAAAGAAAPALAPDTAVVACEAGC